MSMINMMICSKVWVTQLAKDKKHTALVQVVCAVD